MNKLSILNIFVLFAINLNFCGDRATARFTDDPIDIPMRFADVPVEEGIIPIHIPEGQFFVGSDIKSCISYKACNTEQQDAFLDSNILPLALPAHIMKKDNNSWCIKQVGNVYPFIPINNISEDFLEKKKNEKNNLPFYAIDNQGFLYKCEFPKSPQHKVDKKPESSRYKNSEKVDNIIPQKSFIVSSFRKYPNIVSGVVGIMAIGVVIGSWKFADKLFGTNWIMVAINKVWNTNYNTKI